MQAYICDVCKKQEKPDESYNLPPDGWYSLYRRVVGQPSINKHVCTPECLSLYAKNETSELT